MLMICLKREASCFVAHGGRGLQPVLFALLGMFLFDLAAAPISARAPFFLLIQLFAAAERVGGLFTEDHRYGFLDMVWVKSQGFYGLILAKLFFLSLWVGLPLALMGALFVGSDFFTGITILWVSFVCFIALAVAISSLVESARKLKGGVFILAAPLCVPVFLFAVHVLLGGQSLGTLPFVAGSLGFILLYGAIGVGASQRALEEMVRSK